MEILSKLFASFVSSSLYTFFSFLITYGLYRIKGKDIPDGFYDVLGYIAITNLILFSLIILYFKIEV